MSRPSVTRWLLLQGSMTWRGRPGVESPAKGQQDQDQGCSGKVAEMLRMSHRYDRTWECKDKVGRRLGYLPSGSRGGSSDCLTEGDI